MDIEPAKLSFGFGRWPRKRHRERTAIGAISVPQAAEMAKSGLPLAHQPTL